MKNKFKSAFIAASIITACNITYANPLFDTLGIKAHSQKLSSNPKIKKSVGDWANFTGTWRGGCSGVNIGETLKIENNEGELSIESEVAGDGGQGSSFIEFSINEESIESTVSNTSNTTDYVLGTWSEDKNELLVQELYHALDFKDRFGKNTEVPDLQISASNSRFSIAGDVLTVKGSSIYGSKITDYVRSDIFCTYKRVDG